MKQELLSDVAGTVWKVLRQVGDQVQAGDEVAIIESMKMEIPVSAPSAGTLVALSLAEGDVVAEGQVLGTIEAL